MLELFGVGHFARECPYQKGKAKGNGYAYPHSVVMGKKLWLIYSVNKEDIEICQLSIEELKSL